MSSNANSLAQLSKINWTVPQRWWRKSCSDTFSRGQFLLLFKIKQLKQKRVIAYMRCYLTVIYHLKLMSYAESLKNRGNKGKKTSSNTNIPKTNP